MGHLRKKLGEELGDKEHGAIRIYQGLGYFAVSSLEHSSKRPKRMEESPAYLVADNRIKVDTENQLVVCDGEILEEITPRLFVILACLANEPEKVATLEKLGMAAWGSFDRHRANGVRVGVSQLRKNFGPELGNISTGAIRTRFEAGYYAVEVLDS
jgi:DNA-binding response OmpR family regulator